MKTVNVSGLKNNPSEALRMAHDDLVLVMNRNQPDALMIGLKSSKIIDLPGVRKALATALFKQLMQLIASNVLVTSCSNTLRLKTSKITITYIIPVGNLQYVISIAQTMFEP